MPLVKMQRKRCRLLFVPATPSALKGNYSNAALFSTEEKRKNKTPNTQENKRKNKDLPIISFLFFLFFFGVYSAASPFFLYFFLVFTLRLRRFFSFSSSCRCRACWRLPGGRSASPCGPLAPSPGVLLFYSPGLWLLPFSSRIGFLPDMQQTHYCIAYSPMRY